MLLHCVEIKGVASVYGTHIKKGLNDFGVNLIFELTYYCACCTHGWLLFAIKWLNVCWHVYARVSRKHALIKGLGEDIDKTVLIEFNWLLACSCIHSITLEDNFIMFNSVFEEIRVWFFIFYSKNKCGLWYTSICVNLMYKISLQQRNNKKLNL